MLVPLPAAADQTQAVRVAAIAYAQARARIAQAVLVDPVVFAGEYALADWTAGNREGEVLLARHADGAWHVVAFENASLTNSQSLQLRYHVPAAVAHDLVTGILAAEKREGTQP